MQLARRLLILAALTLSAWAVWWMTLQGTAPTAPPTAQAELRDSSGEHVGVASRKNGHTQKTATSTKQVPRAVSGPRGVIGSPKPVARVAPAVSRPPPEAAPGLPHPEDRAYGELTDRTGRANDLGRQLHAEFMPLANECIEMAHQRDPKLAGLLSFAVDVVPLEDGDAVLVESVRLQDDNEIRDEELIECIEQTTLSVEGLTDPESFAITMPIDPV